MLLFLKNLAFTLLIPGTVAVYVPLRIARSGGHFPDGLLQGIAGILLLLSGAAVYLWCLWDFAAFGRGTPAPVDAPKRLVARGLYRCVRNPMYVGVLAVIAGWGLYFGSVGIAGYGLAVGTCFHLFVVRVEEPMLRRRFGESYARYCEQVGRWMPGRPGRG